MRYFVILFFVTLSVNVNAQIVDIPDSYFKGYLLLNPAINTNGDAEIQVSEAEAFTDTIDLTGQKNQHQIDNLLGLQAFKNIKGFKGSLFQMNDILFPVGLSISYLELSSISLSPTLDISALTELETLIIKNVSIDELDISKCVKLDSVILETVPIYELDLVMNLNIEYLNLREVNIISIDVSNLARIRTMSLSGSLITTLILDNLDSLEVLNCFSNSLLDTMIVINNDAMEYLGCGNNPLLRYLECTNNELFYIQCYQNGRIEKVIVRDNYGLNGGHVYGNRSLSYIDISDNPMVTYWSINDNDINELYLDNSPLLNFLDCKENKLTELDVSSFPNLETVFCSSNLLRSINLANGYNIDSSMYVDMSDNSDLSCVQVDDPTWSEINWNFIPEGVSLSADCSLITSTDAELVKEKTIIGYYNTLGQKVDKEIRDQLVLIKYLDGSTERIFRD